MTELMLGYQTSINEDVLSAFLATAQEKYQALEEAIAPIDERTANLRQDWSLRPASFWQATLSALDTIRRATDVCMQLFEREHSQEAPVPLVISATNIAYRGDLHSVNEEIEEVGILLTACIQDSDDTSVEEQIRERRRIMHALEKLSQAVHTAIHQARTKLDKAPEEQRKILTPVKHKKRK